MKYRPIKVTVLLVTGLAAFLFSHPAWTAGEPNIEAQARRRAQGAAPGRSVTYAKFSHAKAAHQMACSSCHKVPTANWNTVRKADAAFPDVADYPEHASCLKCHRQQFFKGAQPVICSVCHTNPSPRDGSRHPFPNPREIFDASKASQGFTSEFGVHFPHDKHIDIVGQLPPGREPETGVRFVRVSLRRKSEPQKEESDPKSCAVCHQTYQPQGETDDEFVTRPPKNLPEDAFWLKKGTFKTSPTGHTTCFTCHSQDSGLQPAPSDCATCHKLLPPGDRLQTTQAHDDYDPQMAAAMGVKDRLTIEKWSRRETAKFRHEWLPHAGLSCTSCHTVATMNTLDEKTKGVAVRSCGGAGTGCHIETTTEGILNLELEKKKAAATFTCTKCHITNGKQGAPASHSNAVATATKK